jgi:hypothetical protein
MPIILYSDLKYKGFEPKVLTRQHLDILFFLPLDDSWFLIIIVIRVETSQYCMYEDGDTGHHSVTLPVLNDFGRRWYTNAFYKFGIFDGF